jgi:predicted transcriptional regulator
MIYDLDVQELLVWLGLSELQAKVYLTLLETGNANAESVSKQARLDQLTVECALFELKEIGLVK